MADRVSSAGGLAILPPPPELERPPLVPRGRGLNWILDTVAAIPEGRTPRWWWLAFLASCLGLLIGVSMVAYLVATGVGVWGLGHPVMWGWAVVNFVWWIGIGHAGTLISAILLLLRQRWRAGVNRVAEGMTLFAVICAGLFPLVHMGRIWFAWWLAPVPNANGVWPQFRSPLTWDAFAVGTYFAVSLMFWYLGLVPDLAAMRDRARTRWRQAVYGLLALGWRGAHRHWNHYEKTSLILAGLSTALVVSVHSIVSLDFAVTQLPGWHSTLFPPYFVAGAIFSGLGMVLTLVIPLRKRCGLEEVITPRHVDLMCKVTLAACLMVAYAHGLEGWSAWWHGNPEERFVLSNRAFGPYAWAYGIMMLCAVALPQAFWFRAVRRNLGAVWVISILLNVGMWFERFVIVVGSLHRDFLPSNWAYYAPTWVDIGTCVGSFGLFFTLFLLFLRFLPVVAISEVKGLMLETGVSEPPPRSREAPGQPDASRGYGLLAEFDTAAALLRAAEAARDAGYRRWDAFTPCPVPGMDQAMGLRNSKVGWFAFTGGLAGCALGLAMVWYMNAHDYPLLVGGKPMFSPFAAFPVVFELTVLLGAFGALAGMLCQSRLPEWYHPLLGHRRFARATQDRFFLLIECADDRYRGVETWRWLETLGCTRIERIGA